jgi:hypothetical protein
MGNSSCKRDVERRKQSGKNCVAAAHTDKVTLPTLLTSNAHVERQKGLAKSKFDNALPTINVNVERQRELAKSTFAYNFTDNSFAMRARAASDLKQSKHRLATSQNFHSSLSDPTGSAPDQQERFHHSLTDPNDSELMSNQHQKFHRSLSEELGYTYVGSRCVGVGYEKRGQPNHSVVPGRGRKAWSDSTLETNVRACSAYQDKIDALDESQQDVVDGFCSDSVDSDENTKRIRGPGWFRVKRTQIKRPASHVRVMSKSA